MPQGGKPGSDVVAKKKTVLLSAADAADEDDDLIDENSLLDPVDLEKPKGVAWK